jgi:hypothetical protein
MTLPDGFEPASKPVVAAAESADFEDRPRRRRARYERTTNIDGNWIAIAIAGGCILLSLVIVGVVLVAAHAGDEDDEDDEDDAEALVVPQSVEMFGPQLASRCDGSLAAAISSSC